MREMLDNIIALATRLNTLPEVELRQSLELAELQQVEASLDGMCWDAGLKGTTLLGDSK
jgi:hypothetical protein